MPTHTLKSLIEELQNVAKDFPERLNEPVYMFNTTREEREALPINGCVDIHIDGYFDLNTEPISQKEETQEDPLSDISERTLTTIKKVEELLKKKKLSWISMGSIARMDDYAHGDKCYILLVGPKRNAPVEATNNRCFINTATELLVVPDITEKEYDVLFAKYGYGG
jgi:hypothetical protein